MNTLLQWMHQHDFLLLVGALLLSSFFLLSWFRLWTKRTLLIWSAFLILAVVTLVGLRSPSATVSEALGEPAVANALTATKTKIPTAVSNRVLSFASIEEIEAYLHNGEKPTLVEFYSDFGIS